MGRTASHFNCTFFLSCILSNQLAVEGAGLGHGVVGTRWTDICAIGAPHPCVTTVLECSYVMD